MKSRARPSSFAPLQPPQVMWDMTIERPVLLLGHWVDAKGMPVMAEVATMSSPRQPYQLSALTAPPPPAPVDEGAEA